MNICDDHEDDDYHDNYHKDDDHDDDSHDYDRCENQVKNLKTRKLKPWQLFQLTLPSYKSCLSNIVGS